MLSTRRPEDDPLREGGSSAEIYRRALLECNEALAQTTGVLQELAQAVLEAESPEALRVLGEVCRRSLRLVEATTEAFGLGGVD